MLQSCLTTTHVRETCLGLVMGAHLTVMVLGGGRLSQSHSGSALQLPAWRPPAEAGPPICTHARSSRMCMVPAHPLFLGGLGRQELAEKVWRAV